MSVVFCSSLFWSSFTIPVTVIYAGQLVQTSNISLRLIVQATIAIIEMIQIPELIEAFTKTRLL